MAIEKKAPTQRTLNAMQTKNTLFNLAIDLFKEYGYERVTVDDIVTRANVSKGTFYNHFESKESVLTAWFNKIDEYYDKVLDNLPKDTKASERLLILGQCLADYCEETCGIDIMRIVYASQVYSRATNPILTNRKRSVYRHLREIAVFGKKTGDIPCPLPTEELTELLMRNYRSVVYDWCLYGEELNLSAEIARHFKLLLHWLDSPSFADYPKT